ncbi:gas vesicle protein [Sinomonas humi]|uniref:gas vesicle protein n=1 Tax=Sinomonas humi TaxID=1338436 RepID=UPI0009E02CB9|nr:gas vesicle protein [Sinomonas humi]
MAANSPERSQRPPLTPRRDSEATLSGLLDVVLNKGVYLDLDAIVTVAEVPLIGISLRAVLAGMETMLEYGMMDDWDERTRAWARRSLPSGLELDEHEEIITRMPGSAFRDELPNGVWQPGTVFLTTRRLLVYRSEPATLLWEAPISAIAHLGIVRERTVGGEEAQRLAVMLDDGATARLTAARPEILRDRLAEARSGRMASGLTGASGRSAGEVPHGEEARPPSGASGAAEEGELWFAEARAGGHAWRRGIGRWDSAEGFTWTGDGDRRPAVRVAPSEIHGVRDVPSESAAQPAGLPGEAEPFILRTARGDIPLATADPARWRAWLEQQGREQPRPEQLRPKEGR